MTRRPGRKSGHSESIPWSLAVEIAGSEAGLVRGVPARTRQWWRSEDAVPAYRVLPFLLARYLATRPVRLVPTPRSSASSSPSSRRRAT